MKEIMYPFVDFYVRLRFRDIWTLKAYLKEKGLRTGLYASYYFRYFYKLGSYIGINVTLGKDIYFPHGVVGIFISDGSVIGDRAVIFQQVTIGSNLLSDSKKFGSPVIGSDAYLGAGSKIIGHVHLGDRVRVGANAVVYQNMESDCVAVASPTRLIQKEHLDNRFIRLRNGKKEYYQDGDFHPLQD